MKKIKTLLVASTFLFLIGTTSCSSFLGSEMPTVEEELRTLYLEAVDNGYFKNYASFINDYFSNPNASSKVKELTLTKVSGTHKVFTFVTENGYKGTSDIRVSSYDNLVGYNLYRHLVPSYSKSENEWSYELHSNLLVQPTKRMLDINYTKASYQSVTKYIELGTEVKLLELKDDAEEDLYFVTYLDSIGESHRSSIVFNKNTYLEAFYEPTILNAGISNKTELTSPWKVNDTSRKIEIDLESNKYANVITALTVGSLKFTSSNFEVVTFEGQYAKAVSEGTARINLLTKNNKILDCVDIIITL